jgi:hypothetical protein
VEDEDSAEDRGEGGGHRGERDDLDALADLQAAGAGVEGDHSGDQRGQRPRAHQPEQRSRWRLGEVLERDIGDAPQRAGGGAEEQSLGALPEAAGVETLMSAATTAKIALSIAISAASDARCESPAPPLVNPITIARPR